MNPPVGSPYGVGALVAFSRDLMVQIMRMIAERLPPRLETLCGFQLASSSCFTTYPLDETASTASSDSDNAD